MSHTYAGGCEHCHTHSDHDPIDNHICHCSVCKGVTGQDSTHVVFFKHLDLTVDNLDGLNRRPFNAGNPEGPLELCTCSVCGAPIMLDDKEGRIRAIVPNLMGHLRETPHRTTVNPSMRVCVLISSGRHLHKCG